MDYHLLWNNSYNDGRNTKKTDAEIEESKQLKKKFHDAFKNNCNARLVAFSNGPKVYVTKVLKTLGLYDLFGSNDDENDGAFLFAVDDVLPHCKPEEAAFQLIFDKIQKHTGTVIDPAQCIMVEDSMKNIRSAKSLGMKTILIKGKKEGTCRLLTEDKPEEKDPAVDVAVEMAEHIVDRLPKLFSDEKKGPCIFEP